MRCATTFFFSVRIQGDLSCQWAVYEPRYTVMNYVDGIVPAPAIDHPLHSPSSLESTKWPSGEKVYINLARQLLDVLSNLRGFARTSLESLGHEFSKNVGYTINRSQRKLLSVIRLRWGVSVITFSTWQRLFDEIFPSVKLTVDVFQSSSCTSERVELIWERTHVTMESNDSPRSPWSLSRLHNESYRYMWKSVEESKRDISSSQVSHMESLGF